MNTGKIIKLLRTTEGIKQEDLAKKAGVSRAYLSQVENSRRVPSLSFLKGISRTLNIPLPLLIIDDVEHNTSLYEDLRKLLFDILKIRLEYNKINTSDIAT